MDEKPTSETFVFKPVAYMADLDDIINYERELETQRLVLMTRLFYETSQPEISLLTIESEIRTCRAAYNALKNKENGKNQCACTNHSMEESS